MIAENKIGIVLGTRPEIIKLAPVIHELNKRQIPHFVIHTGQHYSANMDSIFWKTLNLPEPKYQLKIQQPTHARQTAEMLQRIDEIINLEKPTWVIVQGDTNSTLAGALAASKHNDIKLAHLEAGLRSFDRTMPEEINRIIVDSISDLLLTPTEESTDFLMREGFTNDRIHQVGNTVEDVLRMNIPQAMARSQILKQLEVCQKKYVLLTVHRQENTDNPNRLMSILENVFASAQRHQLPIIFPIHPRTRQRLLQWNYQIPSSVQLIDPVDYYDFLVLESNARLVATDSGGVQEEACILGIPCITLRDNTERPETVKLGANILVGVETKKISEAFDRQLQASQRMSEPSWVAPYGGGKASQRVVDLLQ